MNDDTLALIFRRVFESPYIGEKLRVSWHSGEPMALPLEYYRNAVNIARRLRDSLCPELDLSFDIQTNGTLISEPWCDFLRLQDGDFLVGVSCDGPRELHDIHRRDWANRPTHERTEAGMRKLAARGLRFDVTAVVSPETLQDPDQFLDYFAGFTHVINEFHYNLHDELFVGGNDPDQVAAYKAQYRQFVRRLLDKISTEPNGKFPKVRNFSAFYNRLFVDPWSRPAYDADWMSMPFRSLSVEVNGDVSTFYAGLTLDECSDLADIYGDGRGFVVGNFFANSLEQIAHSSKLASIRRDFQSSHQACREQCAYFDVCSGGYNIIKRRRLGQFSATETPECVVHVQTFADVMLEDVNRSGRVIQRSVVEH